LKSITMRCIPRGAKSNGGGDQGSERRPQNERMRALSGKRLARNLQFVCFPPLFLCNRNCVHVRGCGFDGMSGGFPSVRRGSGPRVCHEWIPPSPPLPSPRHLVGHPGSHMEHLGEPFGGGPLFGSWLLTRLCTNTVWWAAFYSQRRFETQGVTFYSGMALSGVRAVSMGERRR